MVYGDQARYFEMERLPKIKHRKLGAVSMINNGQNMHGSQVSFFFNLDICINSFFYLIFFFVSLSHKFLITLNKDLDYLDGKHTVFGEVAKGFDVLEKFNEWLCDQQDRPYQDIR